MSNHLAVATVTATLHNLLLSAGAVVPGTTVTTGRPVDAPPPGPVINAFLYQVTPNAAYRNLDLPTRRADGRLVQKPQAALVLHYLLSFSGDESKLEPHRLLGAVVRQLHARPSLRAGDITSTIGNPPFDAVLASSNLADQVDLVRLTPVNLSIDELSKMWSVFFQIPYALSVAYEASAVLIETDDAPAMALPVKERNVYAVPVQRPTIEAVVSAAGDEVPIAFNSTLAIRGKQLRGDITQVLIGGTESSPTTVGDTRVTVPVPAGLRAGVHAVLLVHKLTMGAKPGAPHRGFESNVGSFVLQPRIKTMAKTTVPNPQGGAALPALKITVDLTVGKAQRVTLALNSTSPAKPGAFSFVSSSRPSDSPSFKVEIPDVVPGKYFVTVQIDGAPSPVDLDPSSATFGPTVVLP